MSTRLGSIPSERKGKMLRILWRCENPIESSWPGFHLRSSDIKYRGSGGYCTVPDASAKRADINLSRVVGIKKDTVPPFEVITSDAVPMVAPIARDPGGRLETRRIDSTRKTRVHRYVVDMLVASEGAGPVLTGVF